jgi:hypothetical protein
MVGYIYVSTKENTYLSDNNGSIILPHDLPLTTQLRVWHPNSKIGLSKHTLFSVDSLIKKNNEITLIISVNEPAPRSTFESLAIHEH